MAVSPVGLTVPYVQVFVNQGANFAHNVVFTDASTNSYMNLINATYVSRIKKSHGASNVSAYFDVTTLDYANGLIELAMSSANTTNIESGRYVFNVKMTQGTETILLLEGSAIVVPDV